MTQQIAASGSSSPANLKTKIKRLLVFLLKSFLIAVVLVLVFSYIFFCPRIAVPNYLGDMILFPMKSGEEYKFIANIGTNKEVTFSNANGDKLHGIYYINPAATKVVLFCHGNAGNIGHRLLHAKALMQAGASVLLFDYRSYGKSTGKKNFMGLIDDADSAYKYLVDELHVKPESIILYGESVGGGVASTLLNKHPDVGGLILDSAFTSLLGVGKRKIPVLNIYPDFLASDPPFSCIEAVSKKHPPLLIVHGELDGAIPFAEAQANFAAATEPKTLVGLPHAGHNDKGNDAQLYLSSLKAFIDSLK